MTENGSLGGRERRSPSPQNRAVRTLIDVATWTSQVAQAPGRTLDIARVSGQTAAEAKRALRGRAARDD